MTENSIDSLESQAFFQKRYTELNTIFNSFLDIEKVQLKADAAKEVCRVYFEYLDFFKDYLVPEANIYKIISGTELVIARTLPSSCWPKCFSYPKTIEKAQRKNR